ncbi:MAG: 1-acyl-sn-glycerol-3-phosphate acyltransferase, partial [Fidelibacterota bacterium]
MIYQIVKPAVRLALDIFFDEIEIHHPENIPYDGAAIFAANHPSSIMDSLIIGAKINRKLNFLAHSGLFTNRVISKFLRSSGVIPVYRREDASDASGKNVEMFESC